jgi:hypothetical protein
LYRDVGNITENSVANPPLVQSVNFGFAPPTLAQLDQVNPAQNVPVPSLSVLDPHDHHISTTDSWSLTLSQRLPSNTVLEISYVGNTSRHQMTQEQRNINVVPEGAMFGFPKPQRVSPIQELRSNHFLLARTQPELQLVTGHRKTVDWADQLFAGLHL